MTNIVTKETAEIAIPDYLSNVSSKDGLEDLSLDSFTIPRLTLLQSSTKSVKKGLKRPGVYENALTGAEFGPSVELVFLRATNGAVYLTMGEGLKCKSADGKINQMNGGECSKCWLGAYYKDWKDGKPSPCSATFDFICVTRTSLLTPMPELMAISFSRTSYKLAKDKIVSRARALNKPLYAQAYMFGADYIENPKGDYYAYNVTFPGWLNEAEFKAAEKLADMCKGAGYKVQDEGVHESSETSAVEAEDF